MSEAELLRKRIQNLSILARERVASFLTGTRRSLFRGEGTEFNDLRDYIAGDDLRNVDWRATARRQGSLIVREYYAERNTNVVILLDASASMLIGRKEPRIKVATEAIASLSYAAISNKDFIGFGAFGENLHHFLPPRGGKEHEFFIYRVLLGLVPQGATNIGEALREVASSLKRRSLIIILSDMHTDLEAMLKGFRIARAMKHEIQLLQISDYGEYIMPENLGKIKYNDPESKKPEVIDLSDPITKGLYNYYIAQNTLKLQEFKRKLRGMKVRVVEVRTEDLIEQVLLAYFSTKSRGYSNV